MHLTVCILYVEIWQFRTAVPYLQLRNLKGTTFSTYKHEHFTHELWRLWEITAAIRGLQSELFYFWKEHPEPTKLRTAESVLSQDTRDLKRGRGCVCVCVRVCDWSHLGIVVGVVLLISLLLSFLNTQHKETSDYWASSAVSMTTLKPVSHFHQGLK